MDILDVDSTKLFATAAGQAAQMESFAKRHLTRALELFTEKRYAEAIPFFNRALGMAPRSSTALDAYDYLARSQVALGDTDAAIATYRRSLRLAPEQPDIHLALGNLHFEAGRYEEAQAAYAEAVRLNPSAANRYSLGQAYLEAGRYGDAERQFRLVRDQTPREPDGYFGLGLVYARQGRGEEAVGQFRRAIDAQEDFWFAHAELGYALTDLGDFEGAREIAASLAEPAPEQAAVLSAYLLQKTPPSMNDVLGESTFLYTLGPRTRVASLGSYLSEPGGRQTFTMVFQFSKAMDALSVENVRNWSISRSLDTGRADGYNFSLPIPATEISLDRYPTSVVYDAEKRTATVFFSVVQNATGDGTLDPSHIKFRFQGQDAEGLAMDSRADEYTHFSGFA